MTTRSQRKAAVLAGSVIGTSFAVGVLAAITGTVFWVLVAGVIIIAGVYVIRS